MMNRNFYEAVDCTLRDITRIDAPFGGKLIMLGGDFRQVLLVTLRAGLAEVIASCINKASFWPCVKVLRLRQNMRVSRLEQQGADASELREWAQFLERISDGMEPMSRDGRSGGFCASA